MTHYNKNDFTIYLRTDYLKACFHHVDPKEMRNECLGVQIESDADGHVFYIGSDGITILVCKDDQKQRMLPAGTSFIIPIHILEKVKADKSMKGYHWLTLNFDANNGHGIGKFGASLDLPAFSPVDTVNRQNWRRIMPMSIDNTMTRPVSPTIMGFFAKSAKDIYEAEKAEGLYDNIILSKGRHKKPQFFMYNAVRLDPENAHQVFIYVREDVIGVTTGYKINQDDPVVSTGANAALNNFKAQTMTDYKSDGDKI